MRFVLLALVAGCSFSAGNAGSGDAHLSDATDATDATDGRIVDDAPIDAPNMCFGTTVHVCLTTLPTGPRALPASPFDTGGTSCDQIVTQTNGPDLCVLAGTTISVSSAFVAIGSRPLVLVATDSLTVSNTLDVSSTIQPRRKGAGANANGCVSTGMVGTSDMGGGGGGAGGSFGTVGGNGGIGDTNNNFPPAGVAPGGVAAAAQTPQHLRGGCPGGKGGDGDDPGMNPNASPGGPAGDSGGAVALIAHNSITIPGGVYASGAGGEATPGLSGSNNCGLTNGGFEQGGGGAGAGGMIVIDAPAITIAGRVVANGGAGAGGGGCQGGTSGGDGTTASWNARAAAGTGGANAGGNAGNGAQGTAIGMTTNLNGADNGAGAGGGAGGLGVVWIEGALTGGTMMSPAPSAH
ncbi:MAG: hypothetical protein JWO36_2367 [Myxococcales bacterium]|nr:hypothetical protein [Myxococcales bacterium]